MSCNLNEINDETNNLDKCTNVICFYFLLSCAILESISNENLLLFPYLEMQAEKHIKMEKYL